MNKEGVPFLNSVESTGNPGDGKERIKVRIEGYKIIEKIGQGGMGAVYRARQLSLDRDVAIKLLPPQLAKDPAYIERFKFEAQSSAKLSHLNLVIGITTGETEDGLFYFVMEYVEGEPLHKRLKRKGTLPADEVLSIAGQTAAALEHARRYGLVHRDIKPDNLILQKDGTLKVTDLGLAKAARLARELDQDEEADETERRAIGTPCYMSPEQARGEDRVDIRADIYALGGTLYHLLTGKPLFAGRSRDMMRRHVSDSAPSLLILRPDLSPGWSFILEKCLAKDRAERYATPKELEDDLTRLRDGKVVRAAAKPPTKSSVDSTSQTLQTLGLKYEGGAEGQKPGGAARPRTQSSINIAPGRLPVKSEPRAAGSKPESSTHQKSLSLSGKKGTRPAPRVKQSDSTALLLAAGGGVLLVLLLLFVFSGSDDRTQKLPTRETRKQPAPPKIETTKQFKSEEKHSTVVVGDYQQMIALSERGEKSPEQLPEILDELAKLRDRVREQLIKRQIEERMQKLAGLLENYEDAMFRKFAKDAETLVSAGDHRAATTLWTEKKDVFKSAKYREKANELWEETGRGAEAAYRQASTAATQLKNGGDWAAAVARLRAAAALLPENMTQTLVAEADALESALKERNQAALLAEFNDRCQQALKLRETPFGWGECEKKIKALSDDARFMQFRGRLQDVLAETKPAAELIRLASFAWKHLMAGTEVNLRGTREKPFRGLLTTVGAEEIRLRSGSEVAVIRFADLQPEDLVTLCGPDISPSFSSLEQHMAAVRMLAVGGQKQRAELLLEAARKLPGAAQDARLKKLASEINPADEKEKTPPQIPMPEKPEPAPAEKPTPPRKTAPKPEALPNFELPPEAPDL
jgi:serine/threonine protein kinase